MNILKVCSVPVALIAVALGRVALESRRRVRNWHRGPEWERLLEIYDDLAAEQYGGDGACESRSVHSDRFGSTQVHACGDVRDPPVLLFHGVSTCSLMWGDWVVPALVADRYYTVAVDTPCDMGRSYPLDGDVRNCPQNCTEVAEWTREVIGDLNIEQAASLVGYSYGSLLATCVARFQPDLVDKMILMAPAAVFAPIERAWMMRAMTFATVCTLLPFDAVVEYLRRWFFSYMFVDKLAMTRMKHRNLREATDRAGPAQVGPAPEALSDDELATMARNHPTLLVIGEGETVVDAELAVKRAEKAGVQVKLYPNSGHMLLAEYPREPLVDVVVSFLGGGSIETLE